jgi:hypothetical protein
VAVVSAIELLLNVATFDVSAANVTPVASTAVALITPTARLIAKVLLVIGKKSPY